MANEERGEVSLSLDGADYLLRPSFAAIQAAEAATGLALRVLTERALAIDLTLAQLGAVALAFIRAGAPDDPQIRLFKAERIAELVFEEGSAKVSMILYALLLGALTGGVTAAGEAKAAVATGTTIAA